MKTTMTPGRMAGFLLAATILAGPAWAQTKIDIREQCGRPTSEYTIPVGDHPGHMFRIEQSTCAPGPPLEIGAWR